MHIRSYRDIHHRTRLPPHRRERLPSRFSRPTPEEALRGNTGPEIRSVSQTHQGEQVRRTGADRVTLYDTPESENGGRAGGFRQPCFCIRLPALCSQHYRSRDVRQSLPVNAASMCSMCHQGLFHSGFGGRVVLLVVPEFEHQESPQDVAVVSLVDVFILRPQPFNNTFAEVASLLESRAAKDVQCEITQRPVFT